jgi:hypothetical protein
MNPIKKQRIIKWLNFLLLIINITAIITILYLNNPSAAKDNKSENATKFSSLEYLRDRLRLSNEQYQELIKLTEKTYRVYYLNLDLICESNIELLEEMSKDSIDPIKMDKLTNRIGLLNENLKKNTVKYFESIKTICNDDQKYELVQLFKDIMQLEDQCKLCNRKECPRKDRINNLGKK